MAIPAAALELENQSIEASGKPTLGAAYELVRDQWRSGDRDRELGLHLMFLAWYVNVEPPHLTGLDESRVQPGELVAIFNDVHGDILPTGEDTDDAEALYVVGLMASLTPWLLGDDADWTMRSERYRHRYRQLFPMGLDASIFDGRGAYGHYFKPQSLVAGGY